MTLPIRNPRRRQTASKGSSLSLWRGRQRVRSRRARRSTDDPAGYFPWMADLTAARRFIAERTGRPWLWTAAKARLAVGASQAAFKLGLRSVPTAPPVYQGV